MHIIKVTIDKIKIGIRRRTDMGDLEKLQKSIERRGLIHPITITDDLELVAGFRRLQCCKNLGLKEIDARPYDDLDDVERKEIELEENLHKPLTWNETAALRADIHNLKQKLYGKAVRGYKTEGWTMEDTAESLDIAVATLSQDIMLAEAVEGMPSLKKFVSKRQALKAFTKAKETAILTELARRDVSKPGADGIPYILHKGDAYEFMKDKIEEETIDLVIFDPPWGIDVDIVGTSRGLGGDKTSYGDDSFFAAKILTEKLLPEIYRVMKPDTHLYMFVGTEFANYWINFLRNEKVTITPGEAVRYEVLEKDRDWIFNARTIPLVWVKEGGGYTDFEVRFMPRYETILFCNKGLRRLNSICSDVLEFNRPLSVERLHTQQKPVELLQQLIRLSSLPNEIVLDPCAGSFSTIIASTLLGRRSIGIEKDEECYNRGLEWVKMTEFGGGDEEDEIDE